MAGRLKNIYKTAPMPMQGRAAAEILNAIICPVIVVPIFAPKITLNACVKLISPALTNPTTITVVAEELWITAVTIAPTPVPIILFVVSFSRIFFKLSPDDFCSPSDINCIPVRNKPSPPISWKIISVTLIFSTSIPSYYF